MMDMIHAADQMRSMLRDYAPVMGSYFKDLIKQDFTRKEALQIVISMQKENLFGGNKE